MTVGGALQAILKHDYSLDSSLGQIRSTVREALPLAEAQEREIENLRNPKIHGPVYIAMYEENKAQEQRIAELEAALGFLRIQACQFGDFQYRAVSECSQEMIRGIDAALHPTTEPASKS